MPPSTSLSSNLEFWISRRSEGNVLFYFNLLFVGNIGGVFKGLVYDISQAPLSASIIVDRYLLTSGSLFFLIEPSPSIV